MLFEWDEAKNNANIRKHGIAFATAACVFDDRFLLSEIDNRYSYLEERWNTTGLVHQTLICVSHV